MSNFSLIEALEAITIDPYPTKEYRALVTLLKNVTIIMEDIHGKRFCHLGDILTQLTVPLPDIPEENKDRFLATADVHQLLTSSGTLSRFNQSLTKLLYYLLIKLKRCDNDDAGSIMYDFNALKGLVFDFRKFSRWDHAELDEIVKQFQEKLVEMMKEVNIDNVELKLHLFNIVRIMITDLGNHPAYTCHTIKLLVREFKKFYEYLATLPPKEDPEGFRAENQLNFLYIAHSIIGNNVKNLRDTDDNKVIMTDLRTTLSGNGAKTSLRETYLVKSILQIIEINQL